MVSVLNVCRYGISPEYGYVESIKRQIFKKDIRMCQRSPGPQIFPLVENVQEPQS